MWGYIAVGLYFFLKPSKKIENQNIDPEVNVPLDSTFSPEVSVPGYEGGFVKPIGYDPNFIPFKDDLKNPVIDPIIEVPSEFTEREKELSPSSSFMDSKDYTPLVAVYPSKPQMINSRQTDIHIVPFEDKPYPISNIELEISPVIKESLAPTNSPLPVTFGPRSVVFSSGIKEMLL